MAEIWRKNPSFQLMKFISLRCKAHVRPRTVRTKRVDLALKIGIPERKPDRLSADFQGLLLFSGKIRKQNDIFVPEGDCPFGTSTCACCTSVIL